MKYLIQFALPGMTALFLACGMNMDAQKRQDKEDYFNEIDLAQPSWKLKVPGVGFVGEDSLGNPGVWVYKSSGESSDGIAALNFYSTSANFVVPIQDSVKWHYEFLSMPKSVWVNGKGQTTPSGETKYTFIRYYPKPEIRFEPTINNYNVSWCIAGELNPELIPCEYPWINQRPLSQYLYGTDYHLTEWKWADSTIRIPQSTSGLGLESCLVLGNNGQSLWSTELNFRVINLMSLSDGAYLAGAYARETFNDASEIHFNSGYAVVAKMDSKGEIIWRTKIDEQIQYNYEILNRIVSITPDSLLAIGYSGDESAQVHATLLVLFNSSGTVLKTGRFKGYAAEFVSYNHGEVVMYSHHSNWVTSSAVNSDSYLVGYSFP